MASASWDGATICRLATSNANSKSTGLTTWTFAPRSTALRTRGRAAREVHAQVRTDDDDRVGLLDLGNGLGECFGNGGVGRSCCAMRWSRLPVSQRFGKAREQRALFVRRRRMDQHAEFVGAVVAQDLRGLRANASSHETFAPLTRRCLHTA
jgi:hypothetical protein